MIFVECYNDLLFIEFIGYKFPYEITHSGSKAKVIQNLVNSESSHDFGLIDEDTNAFIPFSDEFSLYDSFQTLKLLKHLNNEYYLIVIPNNLERWWERLSRIHKLNLHGLGVLNSRGKFKKRFKSVSESNKIHKFLEEISPNPEVKMIEKWLNM